MAESVTKKKVVDKMTALGVYKTEFGPTIERYVELTKEYRTIYKQYADSGYRCETQTASGTKKSPTVTTLETLRRDILAIEDALGLTPRGLLKLNEKAFEKPKKSKAGGLI